MFKIITKVLTLVVDFRHGLNGLEYYLLTDYILMISLDNTLSIADIHKVQKVTFIAITIIDNEFRHV